MSDELLESTTDETQQAEDDDGEKEEASAVHETKMLDVVTECLINGNADACKSLHARASRESMYQLIRRLISSWYDEPPEDVKTPDCQALSNKLSSPDRPLTSADISTCVLPRPQDRNDLTQKKMELVLRLLRHFTATHPSPRSGGHQSSLPPD